DGARTTSRRRRPERSRAFALGVAGLDSQVASPLAGKSLAAGEGMGRRSFFSRYNPIRSVTMAEGRHPFPFRTRKLSPPAPMVLSGQPGGRVGRCRASLFVRAPGEVPRSFWGGGT